MGSQAFIQASCSPWFQNGLEFQRLLLLVAQAELGGAGPPVVVAAMEKQTAKCSLIKICWSSAELL